MFLSGLVFSIVFLPRLEQQGFCYLLENVLRRTLSIYLTFLISTWLVIVVGMLFKPYSPTLASKLEVSGISIASWLWSFPMFFQPYSLEILAFYVALMPFAALLLWLYVRHQWLGWVLSFGCYAAAINFERFNLPRYPWGTEWYFNPFAWQFVFFLGIVSSRLDFRSSSWKWLKIALAIVAIMVLLFGLRVRWNTHWPTAFDFLDASFKEWVLGWREKTSVQPIRILHFLSLAYLIQLLMPAKDSKIWQSVWLSPIIRAGQNSLQVYAFGVVIMYLNFPLLDAFRGASVFVLFITLDCCLLSLAFAYFVSWVKSKLRSPQRLVIQEKG